MATGACAQAAVQYGWGTIALAILWSVIAVVVIVCIAVLAIVARVLSFGEPGGIE